MPEETAQLRIIGKFDPQLLENVIDRKIDLFRADHASLELVDVEEGVQHARHGVRRFVELCDQLQAFLVVDLLGQNSPSQAESLQRLPQADFIEADVATWTQKETVIYRDWRAASAS